MIVIEHIKHFFGLNGSLRQAKQVTESRNRVADVASARLQHACAENVIETERLEGFVREMQHRKIA